MFFYSIVFLRRVSGGWFFFFSSRRRHTRWNCDWSSDVCSSDLLAHHLEHETHVVAPHVETALLGALGDVGERLGADQVVVADLLGHHLEQQAVLVRGERWGLAGILDARDRLLDGGRAGDWGCRRRRGGCLGPPDGGDARARTGR